MLWGTDKLSWDYTMGNRKEVKKTLNHGTMPWGKDNQAWDHAVGNRYAKGNRKAIMGLCYREKTSRHETMLYLWAIDTS